ncbi:MAG TPA: glutamate--tRNA ligase [Spirochaetota bacterium]|nr:glutamate--tRNA ligase [Spirochaetota bacterium]
MKQAKTRVRFAPSPSGPLHVGNARTALFNYLFARHQKGTFILRIEDTDKARSTDKAVAAALESLQWMGITWDEGPGKNGSCGPYLQSRRFALYEKYFQKLLEEKKIYRCFCTSEEIQARQQQQSETNKKNIVYDGKCRHLDEKTISAKLKQKEPFTYRFKVNPGKIAFTDMVKGAVEVNPYQYGDFIIRRSDGFPTYNFAVVIDDALMKITHVFRGDDHLSNTPRQILIYRALGFQPPVFAHLSMIISPDKQKLSKREGADSIEDFKKQGYLKEAFVNYLALLGWSPPADTEIMNISRMASYFDGKRLNTAPAAFDYNKLNYLNKFYLQNQPVEKLWPCFKPYLEKEPALKKMESDRLIKLIDLARIYCTKTSDITSVALKYINLPAQNTVDLHELLNPQQAAALQNLALEVFRSCQTAYIDPGEFQTLLKKAKTELGLKGKTFFMPIRLMLTGEKHGPDLTRLLELPERKTVLARLQQLSFTDSGNTY